MVDSIISRNEYTTWGLPHGVTSCFSEVDIERYLAAATGDLYSRIACAVETPLENPSEEVQMYVAAVADYHISQSVRVPLSEEQRNRIEERYEQYLAWTKGVCDGSIMLTGSTGDSGDERLLSIKTRCPRGWDDDRINGGLGYYDYWYHT